ncbi:MAG TPA: DNA-3-methyladenine glycosylase [Gemmatimonadales bacterium]|nr:DNA-3-methyladenine glycosylase [Gemmatimonadales bacterium]
MGVTLAIAGLAYDPDVACRHLTAADPRLGALIARAGAFTMRPEPTQSLFAALVESIVYQQLSGKAAETILGRVVALYRPRRFPRPVDILETPVARLRGAGLSAAKTAAVKDLAARTLDGTVPSMARVRRMSDEEVVERLTTVRGIGRWTVEMLLLFRLGRPDVLPLGDLGVRKGFARAFNRRALLDPLVLHRRAERWRPYRSVASWYLWRALDLERA